jgi:hypothetical protein
MEVTSDVALNCVFVETAFECRGLSSMMMSWNRGTQQW